MKPWAWQGALLGAAVALAVAGALVLPARARADAAEKPQVATFYVEAMT
ncbi:MAG TPA: hypothetical protein VG389_06860 [Myxococcota bacterium]|jgi:hypothetical protein|nr:hypothetical protein [Myxococcota bacterium]